MPALEIRIVDNRHGHMMHTLRLEGIVTELHDAVALSSVVRPLAIGVKTTEIERLVLEHEPRVL